MNKILAESAAKHSTGLLSIRPHNSESDGRPGTVIFVDNLPDHMDPDKVLLTSFKKPALYFRTLFFSRFLTFSVFMVVSLESDFYLQSLDLHSWKWTIPSLQRGKEDPENWVKKKSSFLVHHLLTGGFKIITFHSKVKDQNNGTFVKALWTPKSLRQ